MLRRLSLWAPLVLYLGLVFWLSSLPGAPEAIGLGSWDKLAHFGEYGVLGALAARAVSGTRPGFGRWAVWLLAALSATLYGVTDEVHQAFVPGRDADVLDLLADAAGAALGAAAWTRLVLGGREGEAPSAGPEMAP